MGIDCLLSVSHRTNSTGLNFASWHWASKLNRHIRTRTLLLRAARFMLQLYGSFVESRNKWGTSHLCINVFANSTSFYLHVACGYIQLFLIEFCRAVVALEFGDADLLQTLLAPLELLTQQQVKSSQQGFETYNNFFSYSSLDCWAEPKFGILIIPSSTSDICWEQGRLALPIRLDLFTLFAEVNP